MSIDPREVEKTERDADKAEANAKEAKADADKAHAEQAKEKAEDSREEANAAKKRQIIIKIKAGSVPAFVWMQKLFYFFTFFMIA
jgi:multidrug resistance efflux pump